MDAKSFIIIYAKSPSPTLIGKSKSYAKEKEGEYNLVTY